MALNFTQTNTAGTTGIDAPSACASGDPGFGGAGTTRIASDGGSVGSTPVSIQFNGSAEGLGKHGFEITVASGVSWDAGTWTVRLNVTAANMNLTLTKCRLCVFNSSNISQASLGSNTELSISLGSTGVKTASVTGSSYSPSVGDKVMVIWYTVNGSMSSQTFEFTPDQNIDSPFTAVTPSLVWDRHAAMRAHLARKVRDFFLGGLPPKLARLRMIQNAAGLFVPANDPQFARERVQLRKAA